MPDILISSRFTRSCKIVHPAIAPEYVPGGYSDQTQCIFDVKMMIGTITDGPVSLISKVKQ